MTLFKQCFFALILVTIISIDTAKSSLMIEPSIGYEIGKTDLKLTSGSIDKGGSTTGMTYGGRLGYKSIVGLWVAGDLRLLSGGGYSGNSSTYNGKVDRSNFYLDVGFNFPLLLRVWAGYGLLNTQKISFDSGTSIDLKNGGGFKMGVGFTPLPLISINLEYYKSSFTKYSTGTGASGSTSGTYDSSSDSGVILGLSLPLSL